MKRIAKSKLPKNKEASNLATENNQKSERRFIGRDMSCEVCGDKARSHNYGGISCNCCRSFFSHFVLNNVRNYPSTSNVKKCKFQENCTINQVTRRKCRTCRFFKCVSIGMDPSWVLSDYEKPQKLRKEKNSESNQSKVQQQILPQDNTLSEEEAEKIANIAKYYKTACQLIPYNFVSREKSEILSPTKLQILNIGIISTVIRRCVCFARMIPEFQRLSLHDQTNLLRRSVMEMAILRDSVIYDFTAHAYTCNSDVDQYPEVTVEECDMLWPGEISDMYVQLCTRIQTLCPDEASIMLLTPLVLFSDSGGNDSCTEFEDRSAINSAQEYYSRLLEKYLKKVYGDEKGKQIFPRLLSKLPDVTQASQLHQGIPLNMTEDQMGKITPKSKRSDKKPRLSEKLEMRSFPKDSPCDVCGAKARSYNYGEIGMCPNWVISDFKRAQELKQQKKEIKFPLQTDNYYPDKILSEEETEKIAHISKYYKKACELIPYNFLSRDTGEPLSVTKIKVINIGVMSTAIRRFVCFAKMLPEFEKLSLHDQTSLLRRSILEMILLRNVITFDFENSVCHSAEKNFPEKYPEIYGGECACNCADGVKEMQMQLHKRIRTNAPDEASIMLMVAVVLFSDCGATDSCLKFHDRPEINSAQELYSSLLEKHLKFIHGEEKGKLFFPRLLSLLPDITQMAQLHHGLPLNMTDEQVDKMHEHILLLQKKTSKAPPPDDTYFREKMKPPTPKCSNIGHCKGPPITTKVTPTKPSFPALIHTFAQNPGFGEWGIKPDFFGRGPHLGVERAYMRRIPELLENPLDSLVNDVSKLTI
ncbi:Thyroid hormone receptor beta [Folsomia candida]|uniref:Thyroid hormone receptor beta n=1 Tax=Folsomia candida TaxID=158441 RepID=A0A226DHY0_FOLCA|nr:Thyroid hormone receptor beta [Folsomia candida]